MTAQVASESIEPLERELTGLEHQFWSSKPEVYLENADEACLIAFPSMAGVLNRGEMAKMAEEGRWSDVSIRKKGLLPITEDVVVFTYEAEARRRDGQVYGALVSSVYVKRSDGWKLAFHQQTPIQEPSD